VDPGSVLQPGSAIVRLTTPPPVRLRFRLPSRFLAGLDLSDPVRGTSAAFPGVTFTGQVVTVDPTVDRASRNFTAEAELDDPQGRLRPGLFLDAVAVLSARDDALVVPEIAVLFEGPVTYLYRIDEEGRARRAPVELGARAAGMVEIAAGLREGERIVVEGVQQLNDGAKVEAARAAS
jgi:membrane fusion protein (multidrug efflux system)